MQALDVDGIAHEIVALPQAGEALARRRDDTRQTRVGFDAAPTTGSSAHVQAFVGHQSVDVEVRTAVQAALEQALGGGAGGDGTVNAPMPGQVVKLLVAAGDTVELDQPLLIVEAMKMENELRAPKAGKLDRFAVSEGQAIESGQLLATIIDTP